MFLFPESGPELLAVNGKDIPNEEAPTFLEYWGTPEDALYLDFARTAMLNQIGFTLVEHHMRPEELVGPERFTRPPELAPNVRRFSDRAMLKSSVRIDLVSGAVAPSVEASSSTRPEETQAAPVADTVGSPPGSGR